MSQNGNNQADVGSRRQTLGEFLRNLRGTRGLTLREVEDASEVSNAYLSQLETGKINKPSPHILHSLASVYRVSYELLMEKAGYIAREEENPKGRGAGRRARLATFADEQLTQEEEEDLLTYLAFLRSRKGKK